MPFVVARVNVPLGAAEERELKEHFGRAICSVPGKSEQSLMLAFEDNCRLYVAGNGSQSAAYVEASVFANEGHAGYQEFVRQVALAFQEVLGIDTRNVYVRFSDIPVWSVGGMVVDRRQFS